jgi:energy-coupling factor transport system ATP-binding protein
VSVIIDLEKVFYSYRGGKKWALEDISLQIERGEILAVMGGNGAGKTTLCRLFNGIIPNIFAGRFLGNVTVDGENTRDAQVPRLALKVGMVLDDPDAQLFTSSVREETAFGPENLLLQPSEIIERINFALSAAGLCGFEDRSPSTLSGGEKQRLVIASALAMGGKILVLDEPLSRLDPQGAEEVISVLRDLREKYQITVIMATHDSKSASILADRICVLKNGRVAACDTAENIFANSALLEENGIQQKGGADIEKVFSVKSKSDIQQTLAVKITDFCYFFEDADVSIENINLTVADNDFIAIIGKNGCGKTTLLKSITGLLRPSSGDIFIRGKNSKELSVSGISREIGFVMQNPDSQLFTDSVFNEVSFALKNAELSGAEIQKRVQDALAAVGLTDTDAFPHALRRADRTKVVIASVIAMGCKILIFDEVDVGQDWQGCIHIMNIAKELHSKGYTIIFVTHNMSLVCDYAVRLAVMSRSGIVQYEK